MTEYNSYWPGGGYDGVYNWDDPLVAPWWIPGWTSQNRDESEYQIPAGTENFTGPGFPKNLSFCRVTHSYFDPNSSGIGGFLTFMMSDGITVTDTVNSTTESVTMPQRLAGTMNNPFYLAYNNWGNGVIYLGWGHLDVNLFCTDQGSIATVTTNLGQPFTYWVTEHFMGGRQYQITVPSSGSPGPVDLQTLIVPGSITPYAYDPVNPMGNDLIPVPPPSF